MIAVTAMLQVGAGKGVRTVRTLLRAEKGPDTFSGPEVWEGLLVKILPLTPDDPVPDLEERLATLAALGPVEFAPGEREAIAQALGAMDQIGRDAMGKIAKSRP